MPTVSLGTPHPTRLAYVEQGRGAAVVFVHGSLEDYRSWRFQMEPFAARYRAIAYSRRYHYPNPVPANGPAYSAALHAEDLAGLFAGLDIGPAHLVASSYGGYVALCFAAAHPDLVRSLALAEPPLMPWLADVPEGAPLAHDFGMRVWQPAAQAFANGDDAEGVRLFLNAVMGRPAFEHLSPSSRAVLLDNAPAMAVETLSDCYFSPFTRRDAARIDRPALLLQAELSPRLFHLILDELACALPHSRRTVIPGAPHAAHLGNPEVYNRVVLQFLDVVHKG